MGLSEEHNRWSSWAETLNSSTAIDGNATASIDTEYEALCAEFEVALV